MKKIKPLEMFSLFLLLFSISVFYSCSKDSDLIDLGNDTLMNNKYFYEFEHPKKGIIQYHIEFKKDGTFSFYGTIHGENPNGIFQGDYEISEDEENTIILSHMNHKWIIERYVSPLQAVYNKQTGKLDVTLYFEYHGINPKTVTWTFSEE